MYADDTIILADSKEKLQLALNALKSYCDTWKLEINCSKTKIAIFSNRKVVPSDYNFKYGSDSIEIVEWYKYLGVILDSNLNFKPQTGKIKQKLYPIITNFQRNRKFLTPKLAALWYVGPIRSNLKKSAPLLYTTNDYIKDEFLKIENRCLKIT